MTCNEIQRTLFSEKIDELDPRDIEILKNHIIRCYDCRVIFEKVLKANRILLKVKAVTPHIRNEQALTDSILMSIMKEGEAKRSLEANTFLDRLSTVFCRKTIRFACCFIILFFGMMYSFMEYQDMKSIVNLEQRLGKQVDISQATNVLPVNNALRFLYDYYKLSNGSTSYVEITNKLVLMKKENVLALLNNYKELDGTSQSQLNEMRNEYLKEKIAEFDPSTRRREIQALQKEIERLKKELEIINRMEEQE
jgi:hypothetical protein